MELRLSCVTAVVEKAQHCILEAQLRSMCRMHEVFDIEYRTVIECNRDILPFLRRSAAVNEFDEPIHEPIQRNDCKSALRDGFEIRCEGDMIVVRIVGADDVMRVV